MAFSRTVDLLRRARDVGVLVATMARHRRSRPRVVVFASNPTSDPASNLRAWAMAPALRREGWRCTVVPPTLTLAERRRVLMFEAPDVILLQQSRHALNRPSLYPGFPCVFDQDDADYLDERCRAQIIECCELSRVVVAGSRGVAELLGPHSRDVRVLWTATPQPGVKAHSAPSERESVVIWAHGSPLGYDAEKELVRAVMLGVGERVEGVNFWLFGIDSPEQKAEAAAYLAPLRQAGVTCRTIEYLSYEDYLALVAEAAVGLQPVCVDANPYSQGKSFGKVLAYLVGEVPVVASDAVDHPLFFTTGENGFLADTHAEWVDAVSRLLEEPALRDQVAAAAYTGFQARLTTEAAARELSSILKHAAGLEGA